MKDTKFMVVDEDGVETEFEVVLTFFNDEFNKSYVIYKLPGEEEEEVFAAIYDEAETAGGNLTQIETDEEWDMIEEMLNAFLAEEE